jgi:chorismate mutase
MAASTRPACLEARNGPGGADAAASTATGRTNEAMRLRGIRGATTVDANTKEAILEASAELLSALIEANDVHRDDVASAFFTTTPDLTAEFPAVAARQKLGWSHVALMCGHEMNVPGSLPMCLRILLHVNTDRTPEELKFIYLRGARALRDDLREDA